MIKLRKMCVVELNKTAHHTLSPGSTSSSFPPCFWIDFVCPNCFVVFVYSTVQFVSVIILLLYVMPQT